MIAEYLRRPKCLGVSGPAGVGKRTFIKAFMAKNPGYHLAVSCTTRAPRGDEVHGEDYYFETPEQFQVHVAAGDFMEYYNVHVLSSYGSLRSEILAPLERGQDVIYEVNVDGAADIRRYFQTEKRFNHWDIFLAPPSMEELKRRLTGRNSESPESFARRLASAEREMQRIDEFKGMIVNDKLEVAVSDFERALIFLDGPA